MPPTPADPAPRLRYRPRSITSLIPLVLYALATGGGGALPLLLLVDAVTYEPAQPVDRIALQEAVYSCVGSCMTRRGTGDDTYCLTGRFRHGNGNDCKRSRHNGAIEQWNVSRVTSMTRIFYNAKNFNKDISLWDVSRVTSLRQMFYHANKFNQNISAWDVSSVTTMKGMFDCELSPYTSCVFNQDLSGWDVSRVQSMATRECT